MRHLGCATLALAWSALACTGKPAGSSSSSGGVVEPPVVRGYRDFYSALCAYNQRCNATLGPKDSDVAACERLADVELLVHRATYETYALAYEVDDAALQACVTGLSQAACADRLPPAVLGCQNALKPKTARPLGGTCSVRDVEGAPRCTQPADNWCNADGSGCGVCTTKKANGEMCSVNDQCQSAFCNSLGGGTCADFPSAKSETEGCFFTLECKGNLVCAGPVLQKTCVKRSLAGAECENADNGNKPRCVEDLACLAGAAGGTCALPLAAGQPCSRSVNGAAGCADYCVFPSADASMGTCTALTALPTEGQPCVAFNVNGYNTPVCATGVALSLFPDETAAGSPPVATACTCRSRLAAGGACKMDGACASGNCMGETAAVAGTCTSLTAEGAACSNNRDCQSGYCTGSGGRTCQPLPACQ